MANVLIVDDNLDTVDFSRIILESAGHQVHTGNTGKEGLKSMDAAGLPDCVVLDVDMPELNGPGMAHEMLLHDAGEERIPILLVSGRSDLARIAERMGTTYFLTKATPNYAKDLLKILDRALAERRAPTSA